MSFLKVTAVAFTAMFRLCVIAAYDACMINTMKQRAARD